MCNTSRPMPKKRKKAPKRKAAKRPRRPPKEDFNQAAFRVVQEATKGK